MTYVRLNYDVLLLVMEICALGSKSSVARMMQTCRMLQRDGARLLLSQGVEIRSLDALQSLCLFMNAGKTRFHHLRQLELSIIPREIPPNAPPFDALSLVLRQAHHLTDLSLSYFFLLDNQPALSEAIASLEGLKTLKLAGHSANPDNLRSLFSQLKSGVRIASVNFLLKDNLVGPDPVDVLEGLAPHLERLHVLFATFRSVNGAVFPQVESLICDNNDMETCHPLIRAFPNLAFLKINYSNEEDEITVEQRRRHNVQTQQVLRWQHLAYLGGNIKLLHGLALQCHVTTLHISAPNHNQAPEAALSALLRDCSPANLRLSVGSLFDFSALASALRKPSQHVKSLTIEVHDSGFIDPLESPDIVENMLAVLDGLELRYIRLSLRRSSYASLFEVDEVARALRELDPTACARKIMERVQTVEHILLWRDDVPFAAVVEEKEGVRMLTALDEGAAHALCRQIETPWYEGHATLPGEKPWHW